MPSERTTHGWWASSSIAIRPRCSVRLAPQLKCAAETRRGPFLTALVPIARYHNHQARRGMTTSALAPSAALCRHVTSLDKYI